MFSQAWFWLFFASFIFSNAKSALESTTRGDVSDFSGYLIGAHIIFCIFVGIQADHWWQGVLTFAIGFFGAPLVNALILRILPSVEAFMMVIGKYVAIALLVAAFIVLL